MNGWHYGASVNVPAPANATAHYGSASDASHWQGYAQVTARSFAKLCEKHMLTCTFVLALLVKCNKYNVRKS
jgi:hypothetical protein